jgi:sporulation protein YlmC with PRC-barrel domain
LPLREVQSIGVDAIIVPSKKSIVNADRVPEMKHILQRNKVLKKSKLMTTDGRELGTLEDLYFDDGTGAIEGYEVSGGLFADKNSGRGFIPAPQTLQVGENIAFVPPETVDMMLDQAGRTQGAAPAVPQRVGEGREGAAGKLQDVIYGSPDQASDIVSPAEQKEFVIGKTADRDVITPDGTLLVARGEQVTLLAAKEAERQGVLDALYRAAGGELTAGRARAEETVVSSPALTREEPVRSDVSHPLPEREEMRPETNTGEFRAGPPEEASGEAARQGEIRRQETTYGAPPSAAVEQAKGHKVRRGVRADGGVIIAAPGQVVTDRVIERARTYHKERELMDAVGVTTGEPTRSGAGSFITEAGERLREGAVEAKESLGNLWERVKDRVDEMRERSTYESEEQSIKRALGRPVNRAILDRQDNVILNAGELITHQAIDRARRAGVLDILLSSVDFREPELRK